MDTSIEYINMCEKAVEIQEGWYPEKGDMFFSGCYQEIDIVIQNVAKGGNIWLLRQDELQEMVGVRIAGDIEECGLFCGWDDGSAWAEIEGYSSTILDKFSMEQLWLVFVMSKKYSKKWVSIKQEWIDKLQDNI